MVEFLDYVYTAKGFQCHSNHSTQLFDFKTNKKAGISKELPHRLEINPTLRHA